MTEYLRAIVDLDGADLLEISLEDVGALECELAALALEVLLLEDSDSPLPSLIHHLLLIHDGRLSVFLSPAAKRSDKKH